MKIVLILFVFGCLIATALSATRCLRQSDCKEDECCLDTLFFKHAFCERRYGAGNSCPTASVYRIEEDKYYLACPCVNGYECLGKGSLEDGVTVIKNAKCIMPTL